MLIRIKVETNLSQTPTLRYKENIAPKVAQTTILIHDPKFEGKTAQELADYNLPWLRLMVGSDVRILEVKEIVWECMWILDWELLEKYIHGEHTKLLSKADDTLRS